MRKEVIGTDKGVIGISGGELDGLVLSRRDMFVSDEHTALTNLGSHLYGLFVVHAQAVGEAQNNGRVSDMRLKELMREREQRYLEVEEIWGRKIPRDKNVFNYLERLVFRVMNEQVTLLDKGSAFTKE